MNERAAQNCIQMKFSLNHSSAAGNGFSLDVDCSLPSSGITAVFGASGSGKTSLLRCLAGLERAKHGETIFDGTVWQNEKTFIPTHQRPIGYVFQESSLFSHLTAKKNLEYATSRSEKPPNQDGYDLVVATMGISELLDRYPHQLSGGERQRVAIARALLIQPKLLLMDEPLASLDSARKQEILPYIETLKTEFKLPVIYVSHSMTEVARLADYALVLDQGRVVAEGSLVDVFSRVDRPSFTEDSSGVVLHGTVVEIDKQWQLAKIKCSGGDLWVAGSADVLGRAVRLQVMARDVSIALAQHSDTSILNRVEAEIIEIVERHDSPLTLIRLKFGCEYIVARLTRKSCAQLGVVVGDKVWAQIKSAALVR